jgi:hypothetical protein
MVCKCESRLGKGGYVRAQICTCGAAAATFDSRRDRRPSAMTYDTSRLDSVLPPAVRNEAAIEAQRLRRIGNHTAPLSASKVVPGQHRHDSQQEVDLPPWVLRRDGLTPDQLRRMTNHRSSTQ